MHRSDIGLNFFGFDLKHLREWQPPHELYRAVKVSIVILHTWHEASKISLNTPAKPMSVTAVTLKSRGFFIVCTLQELE
ncbi:hypothetical protein CEK60_18055 [Halomonas sp. N3-2A]|nr:hypothetical protein CEK60_18055 [Halomonas sp. N3-2A]